MLFEIAGHHFAGPGGQEIDVGAGRVEQRLAGDPAQLALLLPSLALGRYLSVSDFPDIHAGVQLQPGEHRSGTRVGKRAILVLNAAFVAIIGRANVKIGHPVLDVLLGSGFANALAGDGDLAILLFGEAEDRVQANRQRPSGRWLGFRGQDGRAGGANDRGWRSRRWHQAGLGAAEARDRHTSQSHAARIHQTTVSRPSLHGLRAPAWVLGRPEAVRGLLFSSVVRAGDVEAKPPNSAKDWSVPEEANWRGGAK